MRKATKKKAPAKKKVEVRMPKVGDDVKLFVKGRDPVTARVLKPDGADTFLVAPLGENPQPMFREKVPVHAEGEEPEGVSCYCAPIDDPK